MKRRPGLSSRPIEFMPRRFFFIITREVAPCVVVPPNSDDEVNLSTLSAHKLEHSDSFPSSLRSLFPRTPGIQFVSLHDQLPQASSSSPAGGSRENDDGEFDLGIPQTLRFNDFLTRMLTSAAPPRPSSAPSELCNGSSATAIHQYSPQYFFVRREKLAEVVKAIHLICRWRLMYLGLSPHEALAPFEHLPFLFSTFFAPRSRFQPPNLLNSLMGIAKGVASDLLVHSDMEQWWYVEMATPMAGDESHPDTSNDGEYCNGVNSVVMPTLAPISRQFVVCQVFSKRTNAARGGGETSNSGNDVSPVEIEDEILPAVQSGDRQMQRLASYLKKANIALIIVLNSDVDASASGETDRTDQSGRHALLATLKSSGLAVLDLSTACDTRSKAESVDNVSLDASSLDPDLLSSREESLVERFLDACEQTPGTIAVSSPASLEAASRNASTNSVSTCIGCYLMKHHNFTSQEAIGWIRYCWPKEIPLVHQLFLDHIQPRMWREGEQFRQRLLQRQRQETAESALARADGSESPLGSQISIGRINLVRDSLFGTKPAEKAEIGDRDGDQDERTYQAPLHRHHQSHLSLHQHLQFSQQHFYGNIRSPGSGPHGLEDERDDNHAARFLSPASSIMAEQSAMEKQRRPLTQGSAISVRRLHRPSDGAGFARADFSLLHKFVHQTAAPRSGNISSSSGSSSSGSSSSSDSTIRATASGASNAGLAVGSAMAAAAARASTAESTALTRRTADVSS